MTELATKLIHVGHTRPTVGWSMPPHFHQFHELIVIFAGRMQATLRGQTLTGQAGDILFYPGGVAHEEITADDAPAETFFIGFHGGADLADRLPIGSHDSNGRIRLMISWIYADRAQPSPAVQQTRETFLQAILAELQRDASPEELQLVSAVHAFIHERLDDHLTLEDLARHVGMSKYHFLRRYKELTDRTPMQDLRAIRIEHARELILTTNLPIKTIATQVGMGNEYHLSRMFRKHLDVTPGHLRKWVKVTG